MKQPYNNKYAYDAGRLRHRITFMGDVVNDDGYGGSDVSNQQILSTWAGKEKVSDFKLAGLQGAATNYQQYQYFVIRNRRGFYPQKTMIINYGTSHYTILEVQEKDDPCTFLWIMCATIDTPIPMSGGGSEGNSNALLVDGYLNDQGELIDEQIYDLT